MIHPGNCEQLDQQKGVLVVKDGRSEKTGRENRLRGGQKCEALYDILKSFSKDNGDY